MKYSENIISIELDERGEKQVHIMGYGYYVGAPTETPYRFVEYCWYYVPLEYILTCGFPADGEYESYENVKQYIEDCSQERLVEIYEHYDNGVKPSELRIETLNLLTPCGVYILI